jgi:hypothetical protein
MAIGEKVYLSLLEQIISKFIDSPHPLTKPGAGCNRKTREIISQEVSAAYIRSLNVVKSTRRTYFRDIEGIRSQSEMYKAAYGYAFGLKDANVIEHMSSFCAGVQFFIARLEYLENKSHTVDTSYGQSND